MLKNKKGISTITIVIMVVILLLIGSLITFVIVNNKKSNSNSNNGSNNVSTISGETVALVDNKETIGKKAIDVETGNVIGSYSYNTKTFCNSIIIDKNAGNTLFYLANGKEIKKYSGYSTDIDSFQEEAKVIIISNNTENIVVDYKGNEILKTSKSDKIDVSLEDEILSLVKIDIGDKRSVIYDLVNSKIAFDYNLKDNEKINVYDNGIFTIYYSKTNYIKSILFYDSKTGKISQKDLNQEVSSVIGSQWFSDSKMFAVRGIAYNKIFSENLVPIFKDDKDLIAGFDNVILAKDNIVIRDKNTNFTLDNTVKVYNDNTWFVEISKGGNVVKNLEGYTLQVDKPDNYNLGSCIYDNKYLNLFNYKDNRYDLLDLEGNIILKDKKIVGIAKDYAIEAAGREYKDYKNLKVVNIKTGVYVDGVNINFDDLITSPEISRTLESTFEYQRSIDTTYSDFIVINNNSNNDIKTVYDNNFNLIKDKVRKIMKNKNGEYLLLVDESANEPSSPTHKSYIYNCKTKSQTQEFADPDISVFDNYVEIKSKSNGIYYYLYNNSGVNVYSVGNNK